MATLHPETAEVRGFVTITLPTSTIERLRPLASRRLRPLASRRLRPLASRRLRPLASRRLRPLASRRLRPLASRRLRPLASRRLRSSFIEQAINGALDRYEATQATEDREHAAV